ncbi:MAG: alkaline phosphatase family protein [Caulobacteraceae bacterium]|nr:alkaline phosphatase family protein [Caulobacteraceae bacterium]
MMLRVGVALLASLGLWAEVQAAPVAPAPYDHVFVIIEENKDYDQVLNPAVAPNIAGLAQTYGVATQFFGEVHPSEANYVALLGGDTFGIHDDDAFYCRPGLKDPECPGSALAGYVDHTVHSPHLGDQLQAKGLTWKGYYEDLPEPGSLAVNAGSPGGAPLNIGTALYASKHSGFLNFASAQSDPRRAEHIVGFDQLNADLKSGKAPTFALVVPNQCNEMHGLWGKDLPAGCDLRDVAGLVRRGDAYTGDLVRKIQASPVWRGKGNVAIVITFDEGGRGAREGCCGITPGAPSNYGGGHIPTVVITNHGPRGVSDPTPYSHYSLLLTLEQMFGIATPLGHAADADKGVTPMTPLFQVNSAVARR